MKHWFKYEFGYVNIDSEYLYFTNTGNWSEVQEIKEKSKGKRKSLSVNSKPIIFLVVISIIFAIMIYKKGFDGLSSLTLIIILTSLAYNAYEYLKTGIGEKFKIPLNKIKSIDVVNSKVEITFLDKEGNDDSCKISGISQNDILVLKGSISTSHNPR